MMDEYLYLPYSYHVFLDENEYRVYGIRVYTNDQLISEMPDVTADKAEIIDIVSLCNEFGLSLIHLRNFVEDYIGYIWMIFKSHLKRVAFYVVKYCKFVVIMLYFNKISLDTQSSSQKYCLYIIV